MQKKPGVGVQDVQLLKGCVAAGEDWVNAVEARVRETLDKMVELLVLFEGLNLAVGRKRACIVRLVDVELYVSGQSLLSLCRKVTARSGRG